MRFPVDWKAVNEDTDRLFVKGGWLVRVYEMEQTFVGESEPYQLMPWKKTDFSQKCNFVHARTQNFKLIFIQDPNHEWGVES